MVYFKFGWDVFKKDVVAWLLLVLVFMAATQVLIGYVMIPQMIRVVRKSIQTGVAPAVGDFVNFDHLADDAVVMLILMGIYFGAALFCVFPVYPAMLLMFWTQHLAAENRYEPMDCIKASFAHAKENWGAMLGVIIVVGLMTTLVGMVTCGFGMFVMIPVMWIAWEKFYLDNRDDIFAAAAAAGIPSRV